MATKTQSTRKNKKQRAEVADALVATATQNGAPTLVGEVITWHAGDQTHAYSAVLAALQTSGLAKDADEARGIARPRHCRHAFSRACRTLAAERIIRLLPDKCSDKKLVFQFTTEQLVSGQYEYTKETELTLDTDTGDIHSGVASLTVQAKAELDKHMEAWSTGDITTIVQRLFDRETGVGLTPLRDQGGCYLVLQQNVQFTAQVEQFLTRLGGGMRRLPVVAGTPQGDKAVKESLTDHMDGVIAEYEKTVGEFGLDSKPSTLERGAERIKLLRHTLEGYKLHLKDSFQSVSDKLDAAARKLKERVEQITQVRDAGDCAAECDHCGTLQSVPENTTLHRCKHCGKDFTIEWE
jgi:hypothetical protein